MKKNKTLILIDGHALAFRQYFALERTNMSTSSGTPTWGVFGFFKAIFDLLKNKNIEKDAIAVAFDVSHQTFRVDAYSEYKANRAAMPDSMQIQLEIIKKGLEKFNIPVYTKDGYEADDVIGTITKRACDAGHNVLVLTGDRDAFQLVDKNSCVKVIIPSRGELAIYDWDKVYEKMGVYPDQIVDYKALQGDSSDNIPGIFGIGEKTACKLLKQFQTLENLLANTEKIEPARIRGMIENGIEQAKLSKYLATIVTDLDVNFDFDNACIERPDIDKVTEFFKEMQFYSFLKNINAIFSYFDSGNSCSQNNPDIEPAQLNFFTVPAQEQKSDITVIQTASELDAAIEDLEKQKLIAADIQADIKDITTSNIIGLAFGYNTALGYDKDITVTDSGKSKIYYIPVNHTEIKTELSSDIILSRLKNLLENPLIKKTAHNMKLVDGLLRSRGIYADGFVFDTLLASYEANPGSNHELAMQAIENLNHTLYDFNNHERTKDEIKLQNAPLESVKMYIYDIIDTVLKLTIYWGKTLTAAEFKLLKEIDLPLSSVLADMEINGIAIDINLFKNFAEELNTEIKKTEQKIFEAAQMTFNVNSPKQTAEVIFDKLRLSKRKKRSTSAEILEELAKEHKICQYILDYRKNFKLKTTYIDAFPQLISPVDNRIHTTFNIAATSTGRLSSSNPNLQNIPVRNESTMRRAFVPSDKENYRILSADYSQIELRILAHVSGDKNLISAFNDNMDIHTLTASKVFEVPVDDVTKSMRRKAKAVNFGIIYGQTKYGLAKAIDINVFDAEMFIEKYFQTYPDVRNYMNKTISQVEKNGYVETMFGRRRYFANEITSPVAAVREFARRAAVNFPIQGAGADLMKKAMIECYNKIKSMHLKSKMIVQVHDEIVMEVRKNELEIVKKIVTDAMELGQPFVVPLVIDVSTGDSWAE